MSSRSTSTTSGDQTDGATDGGLSRHEPAASRGSTRYSLPSESPPAAMGSDPPTGGPVRPDTGPPPPGAQSIDQPGSGLGLAISGAVAVIVFVLSIYVAGDAVPAVPPEPPLPPLAQRTTTLYWLLSILALAVAGFGAQYAERTAAQAVALAGRARPASGLTTAWIVPSLATLAAVLLVATFHNTTMMAVGPLIAFLGNAGALLSRDLLDDAAESNQRAAITIHTLVIHAVAFLALSAIYINKLPTAVTALLVAVVGGLLTVETLERSDAPRETRLLSAGLAALVLAEAALALNWWPTYGWTGGAVLLVCFYLTAGVLLARTQRSTIRARDLIEFGAVSLVAFVILAITA